MTSLSVVIPTHGRPTSLSRLLASIGESEGAPSTVEVVVVDDGSAAGSYDAVARRFPEVRWLRQGRAGPATARNTGWRASTAPNIVFVDDDCTLETRTLERLVQALDGADAVGAEIEPLQRGQLIADFMHAEHLVTHKVEDGQVRWLVSACLAVRRSALEQVGGFDEALPHPAGEDVDLSLRMRELGLRLAVCTEAVARHDHRASLGQLVRTYYRHGTGQRHLARRHSERRSDLARSTRERLSLRAWSVTYRRYRSSHGVLTSAAFVGLRAMMMVPWLVGAQRGSGAEP